MYQYNRILGFLGGFFAEGKKITASALLHVILDMKENGKENVETDESIENCSSKENTYVNKEQDRDSDGMKCIFLMKKQS